MEAGRMRVLECGSCFRQRVTNSFKYLCRCGNLVIEGVSGKRV